MHACIARPLYTTVVQPLYITGMSEGLGLGTNAMAGLVTRGCVEMKRIAQVLGGRPSTLSGLSGIYCNTTQYTVLRTINLTCFLSVQCVVAVTL
jgi:NAD-dependent glycerol-3-phosphate dehydrogenase C-terminus